MAYGRNYRPFADALRHALHRWKDPSGEGRKAIEVIAAHYVDKAIEGDLDAAEVIANRLDGKPHQSIDATIAHQDAYELMSDQELAARIADLQRKLAEHRAVQGSAEVLRLEKPADSIN